MAHLSTMKKNELLTPINIDESHRYYVEHKKVDTKEYVLYNPIYVKFPNR